MLINRPINVAVFPGRYYLSIIAACAVFILGLLFNGLRAHPESIYFVTGMFALAIGGMILKIILVTKALVLSQIQNMETLRLMGASKTFISRQFHSQFMYLYGLGAFFGGMTMACFLYATQNILAWSHIMTLIFIPIFVIVISTMLSMMMIHLKLQKC